VTVVIPSYRDAERVAALVASIRSTAEGHLGAQAARTRVRIVVADDASDAPHVEALRRIEGIELVEGRENRGFAANVNRGMRAADPHHDVVILNSDVLACPGWLECLQYDARGEAV